MANIMRTLTDVMSRLSDDERVAIEDRAAEILSNLEGGTMVENSNPDHVGSVDPTDEELFAELHAYYETMVPDEVPTALTPVGKLTFSLNGEIMFILPVITGVCAQMDVYNTPSMMVYADDGAYFMLHNDILDLLKDDTDQKAHRFATLGLLVGIGLYIHYNDRYATIMLPDGSVKYPHTPRDVFDMIMAGGVNWELFKALTWVQSIVGDVHHLVETMDEFENRFSSPQQDVRVIYRFWQNMMNRLRHCYVDLKSTCPFKIEVEFDDTGAKFISDHL